MPTKYPFAVRLIGFDDRESDILGNVFAVAQGRRYDYFRLLADNLQDPDIFLANADDVKSLAKLSYAAPSDIRPALMIGMPALHLSYPCMPRPIQSSTLLMHLDALAERRAETLARLEASAAVKVPERRRYERLDIDLTDPDEYRGMRRAHADGGVLVIDKTSMVRDFLAGILKPFRFQVEWAIDEGAAIAHCSGQNVAIVLINTSTPGIDPYRLCEQIKRRNATHRTSVIMLVGKPFVYDQNKGRCAGCDGFLNKPLAVHHLLTALKKFLPPLQRQ